MQRELLINDRSDDDPPGPPYPKAHDELVSVRPSANSLTHACVRRGWLQRNTNCVQLTSARRKANLGF